MNRKHHLSFIHKVFLVLLFGTLSVITLYYQFGDTQRLAISPEHFTFLSTDDRQMGGSTESRLQMEGHQARLQCQLNQSEYAWPYCSVSIQLSNDITKGIDLSNYHTVRLNIDYHTNDPEARLRVYLRNYNSAYSRADNEYSVKYNGLEFAPGVGKGALVIPMENFQVMTWWLADFDTDIEHAAPEFSNVVLFEIATGSHTELGEHDIKINSIEFEGHFVDGEKLMLTLVLIWTVLGVALFWFDHSRNLTAISQANARHLHLKTVNDRLRQQNTRFAEMAQVDALTGARNRHSVRNWLDNAAKQTEAGLDTLSMIYLDIDHFKRINDTFGHQIGDDILKEFVLVVSAVIRPSDHLVRWGGEEFIVFCRDSGLEQAQEIAERILCNVREHAWLHGEPLTCSAGVAEMENERMTETMARADEALYQAKHLGRDRVEVHFRRCEIASEQVG
ncbi:GGDEF domain-containing protein [Vibrio sp. vnigr-6D03]|uniref:GGDEF domain-containing protein n=1 Tax=Vibrio sp. vnigr-6D03 TaxID=2058088 RepID=UPI000C3210FE|nr:GGDEF domain-containing protein [Vibrio sp. vnigr-6D03]PKF80274.1 GGDEF domain-containing protein [Vibrio sp. vnigr-6D03]